MINILTCVQGDPLSFAVYHEVDGVQYELKEEEKYRVKIRANLSSDETVIVVDSETAQFDFDPALPCGRYYFEILLVSGETENVILPATDADGNRNNTIIVTERL